VCPSSTTSTVLKICDGFGNILSGIPSTKTFDAALFILGVDKTSLGKQNASLLLSSSGAVVPDRDANGTDTEEGNSIVVLLASVVKTIVVKEKRKQRKERRKRKKRIFVVVFKASY